jgi:hypothetical protein
MILGLCGVAGAGKSSAASYLSEHHGFARTRFAEPLKAMMRAIGLSEAQVDGDLKGEPAALLCGRTPRHAMQTIGTEWGRDLIHPDLWITLWTRTALEILEQGGRVVVDDVRFPNEVEAIQTLGGRVVCIKGRGGIPGDHVSEQPPPHEITLWNDGPLDILGYRLDGLLERLRGAA